MCGFDDIATSEEKIISSPNWPQSHNNFDNCSWLITTDDDSRIEIIFDRFNLEANFDFLVSFIMFNDSSIHSVTGTFYATFFIKFGGMSKIQNS